MVIDHTNYHIYIYDSSYLNQILYGHSSKF
jgi:hypothetical protein